MADEGGMQSSHAKEQDFDAISSKSVVLKVVEIVASIISVGLIVDPFNSFNRIYLEHPKPKLDDIVFIYVTIAGFLMINTISVLGHLLGDRMPKRTSLLFTVTGAILHIVAGSLMIHSWKKLNSSHAYVFNNAYPSKQYMDMLIASTFFTFVNALVFAADVFFTIKYF